VAAQLAKYESAPTPSVLAKDSGFGANLACLDDLEPKEVTVQENAAYDHDFQVPTCPCQLELSSRLQKTQCMMSSPSNTALCAIPFEMLIGSMLMHQLQYFCC
jgi:hypothetical protein